MLHSLSHLLLTQIALECGNPAASLREQVYALPDERMFGILGHRARKARPVVSSKPVGGSASTWSPLLGRRASAPMTRSPPSTAQERNTIR
jgi:hypothetical protein